MHKKFKAISGSLMAATMLASSVAAFAVPVTANAGQQLGQTDFEDGTGLPWHTCETNPARQHFEITDDGKYVVYIDNPDGSDGRWDLQLRHRGLKLETGHKYTVKAEITASDAGYVYAKIGNYSGDAEYWHDLGDGEWKPHQFSAGETLTVDTSFTASNIQEGPAEWAFHYANNNGKYQNNDTGMPAGSTITFDNLSLIDETSDTNDFDKKNEFGVIRPQSNVRLNQVGYFENLAKKASYVTDASTPLTFHIYNSSGTEVYKNTASKVISDDYDSGTPADTTATLDKGTGTKYKDSGKYVQILDFSDFTTGGTGYYIVVDDTTGVSGTRSGKQEKAYDTTIEGDKVMWENWKTGVSYQMNKSHEFNIANTVYDGLLRDSINYFYQNRSGCPIESAYISSGDKNSLSHTEFGHSPDTAYVQSKWIKAYDAKFDGDSTYSITATGGWYDAGDHGKYVVNGGVSVWTLQNMYEMTKKLGTDAKWTDGKTMLVPEGGDKVPDVLDEARYELDWMFDMIVDSKDPYYGKDAGLVYHKLHDHKWTGLAIHAWKYEGFEEMSRIVKPPTYAATFNMIACAAQAARLWKDFDSAYADECLKHAETSLAAVEKLKSKWDIKEGASLEQDDTKGTNKRGDDVYFAPLDQAIGGGPYGDTYVGDDYYWALCELYATTGKEEYLTKLKEYKNPNDSTGMDKALSLTSNLGGGENKGSFSSFNWGCTSGLGTLSLYLNSEGFVSDADHETVVNSILKAADNYIEEEDKQGMGIPYHGSSFQDDINIGPGITVTGYEWGSNSFVANNAIVMAYAYDAAKEKKYIDGASIAMDYIFGRNGNDFSYVSGYGDVALQYPHHRLWAHGVDPEFPMAPAGCLSGGPGAGMQDPYVGGLGYKRGTLASQKCYVDSAEAWSVNEITINWNAPLAWMANYLMDVAPKVGSDPVDPPTKPATPETTTAPETPTSATPTPGGSTSAKLWGDANEDSKVNVADAVAVLQYICNQTKYALTEQGLANADLVDPGKGITGDDVSGIQKLDASLISQADCPLTAEQLKAKK